MTTARKRARRASFRTLLLAGTALLGTGSATFADTDRDDVIRDADEKAENHFRLEHHSLVVSSSTYDRTQGAVATLTIGSTLAGTATSTAKAVATNNYVTVWNNAAVDGSFGVTSAIELTDVEPFFGFVFHRLAVPTDEVVTSFSSKSELALNLSTDHSYLTFMGYIAPIDALDVSNSNTAAAVDPTNPVGENFSRAVCASRSKG